MEDNEMTEKVNDVFKHCFERVCGNVAVLLNLKENEAVNIYTDQMIKAIADCGVQATREEVEKYIAEQYNLIKTVQGKEYSENYKVRV